MVKIKFTIIIFILGLLSLSSLAQIGGKTTYKFLTLSSDARITALGGSALAINDNDLGLAIANPSLINENLHSQIGLSYAEYFSDINYGFAAYSHNFNKIGSFVGSMQYINYGKFTEADETGLILGDFTAADYALNIGWGRNLSPRFAIGSNLKFIYSSLYQYNSFGLAVDLAACYQSKSELFAASIIAQNIGTQITKYRDGDAEALPFELSLAVSNKLKHAPLRFLFNFEELQKFNLTWTDPSIPVQYVDPITGDSLPKKLLNKFLDKSARHFIPGVEILPSKNFSFRVAYNYRRSKEMRVDSKIGTVGFSWGFGFRIKKFNFSYARSAFHLAGSPNHITISAKLSDFKKL